MPWFQPSLHMSQEDSVGPGRPLWCNAEEHRERGSRARRGGVVLRPYPRFSGEPPGLCCIVVIAQATMMMKTPTDVPGIVALSTVPDKPHAEACEPALCSTAGTFTQGRGGVLQARGCHQPMTASLVCPCGMATAAELARRTALDLRLAAKCRLHLRAGGSPVRGGTTAAGRPAAAAGPRVAAVAARGGCVHRGEQHHHQHSRQKQVSRCHRAEFQTPKPIIHPNVNPKPEP